MDDFENLFMSKMVIFQDSTGANEGAKASKACFGFPTQLSMSTPHHRAKLVTWIEGDIYGFLQLVTIEVRHTGRTLFNEVTLLGTITFRPGKGVDAVINRLHDVQTRANNLSPDKVCDKMLRGAFLSACHRHPDFKQLAVDFSKKSCTLTYAEIQDEMREHEANSKNRGRSSQDCVMQAQSSEGNEGKTAEELKAMIFTLLKGNDKGKKEACRNLASKGSCRYGNNCHFEHTSGSGKIAREGRKGARKQIKCYNCQKMGSHIAADCPHPKALRQGASAATELKEGETTLSDFLQHLPPTKNNQRANMMREFDEPLELAACEPTTQDSFDEPLHAAQFR